MTDPSDLPPLPSYAPTPLAPSVCYYYDKWEHLRAMAVDPASGPSSSSSSAFVRRLRRLRLPKPLFCNEPCLRPMFPPPYTFRPYPGELLLACGPDEGVPEGWPGDVPLPAYTPASDDCGRSGATTATAAPSRTTSTGVDTASDTSSLSVSVDSSTSICAASPPPPWSRPRNTPSPLLVPVPCR